MIGPSIDLMLELRYLCRLAMAKEIHYEDDIKQKAHDVVDLMAMEHELNLTCEAAEKLQTPVVWSHNDLLSGNVLVTHQASSIL